MKDYKPLYEKQKELIKMLTPHGAEFCGPESDKYFKLIKQIKKLEREPEESKSFIVTVKDRVKDIYDKRFNGHPSREDDAKNKEAILFLAEQIDILHRLRIKK